MLSTFKNMVQNTKTMMAATSIIFSAQKFLSTYQGSDMDKSSDVLFKPQNSLGELYNEPLELNKQVLIDDYLEPETNFSLQEEFSYDDYGNGVLNAEIQPETAMNFLHIDNPIQETLSNLKYDVQEMNEVSQTWQELQLDAVRKSKNEPVLLNYFYNNILKHKNFQSALVGRLSNQVSNDVVNQKQWEKIITQAFYDNPQLLYDMKDDLLIIKKTDASWTSHINAFLYLKGYSGLGLARVAQYLFQTNRKDLAFIIQRRVSELYAMDIHPGSKFEGGIFFDHASGLVVGETATIGRGTYILHNVTLGSSGKEEAGSDRHPKIGRNCFIGSNASILGNINIGNDVKIGAQSVVLKPVPDGKVCVGIPAKIL